MDSCQNSVSGDQYHLTVSWAQVSTYWVWVFLKLSGEKLLLFKWSQAQVQFFLKCIWNKLCSWAALLKFWFQADLGRENSTGFYMQGRQSLLTFLSRVDHALSPLFVFWLVKIWQVSSRGKFLQRLETCSLIAEADRVLCHLVMFWTVFFHLMYKM